MNFDINEMELEEEEVTLTDDDNLSDNDEEEIISHLPKRSSKPVQRKAVEVEGSQDEGEEEMDVDLDDPIVSEQKVYLTNNLKDELYCLQYPLRPAGRYMDLPTKARIKPKHERLEAHYPVDQKGIFFDVDALEHLKKEEFVLRSEKVPPRTHYVLGVLRGGDLHLASIKGVLQMRPSFSNIDENDAEINQPVLREEKEKEKEKEDEEDDEKEEETVEVTVSYKKRETQYATKMRENSYAYKLDMEEKEEWEDLVVYDPESELAQDKFEEMIVSTKHVIAHGVDVKVEGGAGANKGGIATTVFTKNKSEFLLDMCDGERAPTGEKRVSNKMSRIGFNKKSGQTQVSDLLFHGKILPFQTIYKLATNCESEERCVEYCSNVGRLVQGLWVYQSELITKSLYEKECRDFIILTFQKYGYFDRSSVEKKIRLKPLELKRLLEDYAILNTEKKLWFLKYNRDRAFLQKHEAVAREQEEILNEIGNGIEDRLREHGENFQYKETKASVSSASLIHLAGDVDEELPVRDNAVKTKIDNALTLIMREDQVQGVYSEENLVQRLTTVNKLNSGNRAEKGQLWTTKAFPIKAFQASLKSVALEIPGRKLYVRAKTGDPEVDACRPTVIELFGTKTSLKKKEVETAVSNATKIAMRPNVYGTIMKELAISQGSTWHLKPGIPIVEGDKEDTI